MPFRFNARSVFLTYPQCPLDKTNVLERLLALEPTASYAIVAHELHEDGSDHLHAVIGWPKPRDIRSERHFDMDTYHPNIQSSRSIKRVVDYVKKGGDFVSHGNVPNSTVSPWRTLCDTTNKSDFWKQLKENCPKEYILNYERLEYFVDKHFKPEPVQYTSEFTTFNVPPILQQWVESTFNSTGRRLSLVLCSPSRYGKTEWARSLGNHMYFNNMVNFKDDWNDSANYIVFDDIDWQYLPNKKGFFGMQKQFVITEKYMRKKTVQWGKPVIFLCNQLPLFEDPAWYEANCLVYTLTNKFF